MLFLNQRRMENGCTNVSRPNLHKGRVSDVEGLSSIQSGLSTDQATMSGPSVSITLMNMISLQVSVCVAGLMYS